MSNSSHPSSYRDPSGFVFEKNGILYRQVNKIFKKHFDFFIQSGCYGNLVQKDLLISHVEISQDITDSNDGYKTIKPQRIPFISYPYEWSFDMLKDAALLTLNIVKECLAFGVILKDATPYNIQWYDGRLIFIDTLSFEKYNEEEPWIAYRQFCECFLSPLLLMHYSKNSLQQLLLAYPEGIPLRITKSLLPVRSKFSLHTYLHIHVHASVTGRKKGNDERKLKFSRQKLINIITSLETLVRKLKLPEQATAWSGYYDEVFQRKDYLPQKKQIVEQWVGQLDNIKAAVDLGANEGEFSKLLSAKNIQTIASDFDAYCINKLYESIKTSGENNIQPLIIDVANPSPSIGLNNKERESFIERTKVDLALSLALIHHLAIGKNIPFSFISQMFAGITNYLIIEFIPKEDSKIQMMLAHKNDIYTSYNETGFINAFENHFSIIERKEIVDSGRILFLMKKK